MAANWLTAGSGVLKGRIPTTLVSGGFGNPMAGISPPAAPGVTDWGQHDPMTPEKVTSFGDDAAFSLAPGKVGFGDDAAFGGVGKMGYGDDLTIPSLAIKQSTAVAQQGPMGPGAAIGSGATPATAIGGPGGIGSLGGDFSPLDTHNAAFLAAGQKWGLDPNLIKAVAMMEGGWADPVSDAGALGIMQIMPKWWSDEAANLGLDFKNNPYDNIVLGGYILKHMIDQWGSIEQGVKHYLGEGVDPHTGISTGQYWNTVNDYWQKLGGSGGGTSGSNGSFSTIFQSGGTVESWGEFNTPSSNGLYGYGTQYGLNGVNHTGLDVKMNVGTAYYAPMSGRVMCAGTGIGQGADGGGCAAFRDDYGQGAGRVEVLLDNGTVLIFGHSSTSALRQGDRFTAGQLLGTSGGMNSPHIHLEARIKDASTPSGWRIVDPRTVLGGGGGTTPGGFSTPAGTGGGYPSASQRMLDIIRRGT